MMKYLPALLFLLVLTGCEKTGELVHTGASPSDSTSTYAPPYGLTLMTDSGDYKFGHNQVSLEDSRTLNTFGKSVSGYVNYITFMASDSNRIFTIKMTMWDLVAGNYYLNGDPHIYYNDYYSNGIFGSYQELYSGTATYQDSSGTYNGILSITFSYYYSDRIKGFFTGMMTNAVTHAQSIAYGSFYK